MVVKKKTAKIEAVILDSAKLESVRTSLTADGDAEVQQLAQTVLESLSLSDPVQQIQLVKKAGGMLEKLPEEYSPPEPLLLACLDTLSMIYTSLQAKNALKRAIGSALGSVPTWLQEQTSVCLSSCLSDCLGSSSSECYAHITDTITSCLDVLPVGTSSGNLSSDNQLCRSLFRGLSGQHVAQAQLMHECLAAVKASMLVMQRSQKHIYDSLQSNLQQTLSGLLDCYTCILTNEEFVQAVQSTAGMAVVLLIRSVLANEEAAAVQVSRLLRCSVEEDDCAPLWLSHSCAVLLQTGRLPTSALYLCHGALAMLSWRGRTVGHDCEELLLLIPEVLLSLDTSVKESSTAMVVARVFMLWSGASLDCLQGENCPPLLRGAVRGGATLPRRLLEHVYAHWDHPLDGVRHQTRSLFRNLLLLHQASMDPPADSSTDPYITSLACSLLELEWHMRGKYGSLACLVEQLGAQYLLALDAGLPSRLLGLMGDQTLAPYAGELLEKLFVSHKTQLSAGEGTEERWMETWHQTWVRPLMEVLCQAKLEQTTYIMDYFLPRLLRCNPASLGHMVRALQEKASCAEGAQGSRGTVGALMTCMRAARAQGVLQPMEESLWALVPLPLLRHALVHKHDQVRMDTLGLVCESHRSTETVSWQEMDLTRHFLPRNLNSQSPGVRQQTVGLLKKLLCRLKDSAQLLQKRVGQERDLGQRDRDQQTLHMYKEFLWWFSETLFQALVPGSAFSTCLLALQLLVLVSDLFTFSTGTRAVYLFVLGEHVSEDHAEAVLHCLTSNFLEVKQLASTLLRRLPTPVVHLRDSDRLQSLLKVALDLSTSTRPFDSVTAAHILNLLLHQPHFQKALLHCIPFQLLPTRDPQASDEPSALEMNTLALVQVLMKCLRDEVIKAELSLLQAAAACPLYGRLHCITVALQQLDTQSLVLTSQWQGVVSELIPVCYRMSDVVAPVVQSSSPEGLIPMDADSDMSAALQHILHEIQPRHTNDFFTSAWRLDTNTVKVDQQSGPTHTGERRGGERYRVTAQMVLVCCWRSMKEVCMLLGEVCQSFPLHSPTKNGLITEEQVEGVGQYFREQLLQSRHRGAFELAYVGFVGLTDMLCRSGSQKLQQLPSHWLREVLGEVRSSDRSSKLCATRRSAGIPFYIQALVSSEPKSSSRSLLKMTMKELTALAMQTDNMDGDGGAVPQVHALNILRALYRDTRLGENIIPFVAEGLQAAVLGFTSPIWAVRNSSTLLFSTLITRIFGVKKGRDEHSKKNRMTGREFFTRFPALYPFLLTQLEEAVGSVNSDSGEVKLHPSLFLLLLVLGRLYPSPMDGSASPLCLAAFVPFIIRCGRSAVYRTREMAARALVPFVQVPLVPATIQTLLEGLPLHPGPGAQQNHIHGTLLQGMCVYYQYSLLISIGFIIICMCAVACLTDSALDELRQKTLALLMDTELVAASPPPDPGSVQYLRSLARVGVRVGMAGPQAAFLACLLRCPVYEVRELALDEALRRLQRAEQEGHGRGGLLKIFVHIQRSSSVCQALQILSIVPLRSLLPWSDGEVTLSDLDALQHNLKLAQIHTHSVELFCASLRLCSRLVVHLAENQQDLSPAAVAHLGLWAALVKQSCGEEQPTEVKLMAAEVLVRVTKSLLTSTGLPLGLPHTLELWQSLFTLLQDEEQDVRARASDYVCSVPADLLNHLHKDVAPGAVCPPVALQLGVALLCHLLQVWDRVGDGVTALIEWLLGDSQMGAHTKETELYEDFLFEKGDLNLWVEPFQWARLLHMHISALVQPMVTDGFRRSELLRLSSLAREQARACKRSLGALPPLPQFSNTVEHSRLTVQAERAKLGLDWYLTSKAHSVN
uniref:tRNA (32-2'-O)-methyltransferase regulator THADA n=1 Tax=Denticeps clupeoides TaxID=299321 RepID=A0AAY4DDB0_9TELE